MQMTLPHQADHSDNSIDCIVDCFKLTFQGYAFSKEVSQKGIDRFQWSQSSTSKESLGLMRQAFQGNLTLEANALESADLVCKAEMPADVHPLIDSTYKARDTSR